MLDLPIWQTISGDVSWLERAAEQQRLIEEHVNSENVDGLVAQNPAGSGFLQPFLVVEAERRTPYFQSVKETATVGKAKASETSAAASELIADLLAQTREEDQAAIKDDLEELRKAELRDVQNTFEALAEVADPEESKSQNEVLEAKYGTEAIEQMGPDQKSAAYEELVAERILDRERASYASAQALLEASTAPATLRGILAAAGQVEALIHDSHAAASSKEEANVALDALKQSVVDQEQKCASCEVQKRANLAEGDKKRAALKKALQDLQQASTDYCSWYTQNEALRFQIQRLKSSIDYTKQEVEAAVPAWQEADSTCQEWLENAEHEAGVVRAQQTEAAQAAVAHAAEAIEAASVNTRVGMELCEKILGDKQAEIASLEQEKQLVQREVQELKAQLKAPCPDMRAKRAQLAQQKDKLSKYDAQIAACKAKHGEVTQTLSVARAQCESIDELHRFGLSMQERDITRKAHDLCEEAYGHLQCFAAEQPSSEQPPSGSGVLSALPPDMKAVIQTLLEEQKATLMLQIKADLEVRGRSANDSGQAAYSFGGSDAGESVFNMVQELGFTEHVLPSDASAAPDSSSSSAHQVSELEAQNASVQG